MKKVRFCICLILCNYAVTGFSQFDARKLSFRLGYNLLNPDATRFNTLIDQFNNDRYPTEISRNLPSLNFLHGFTAGANYHMNNNFFLHVIFKTRHQYLETRFTSGAYNAYLFSFQTIEGGASGLIEEKNRFRHYGGFGCMIGSIGAYTRSGMLNGNPGAGNMMAIDRTFSAGLSLSYEVQFWFSRYAAFYLRPVVQYAANSELRSLNAFLNPSETDNGLYYSPKADSKYNKGSLNGIGIEGGVIIRLTIDD